jgi:hypothetical protein
MLLKHTTERIINSQLKMVGRQLESEEVREVVFGEHGNQNELTLMYCVQDFNYKIIQQRLSSSGTMYESSCSTRTLVSTFELNREGTSLFHSLFCAMSGLLSSIPKKPNCYAI